MLAPTSARTTISTLLMLYALSSDSKIRAKPGAKAFCPGCEQPVIPKCGRLKIWHWAHKVRGDCDWCRGETEWHRQWKALFPAEQVEIKIGNHRADAVDASGRVWEFQSKSLQVEEIEAREFAYSKMVWVWNVEGIDDRLLSISESTPKLIKLGGILVNAQQVTYQWVYPRERIVFCQKPMLLDFGTDQMLLVKCCGWGWNLDNLTRTIGVRGGRYYLNGYLLQKDELIQKFIRTSEH